MLKSTHPVINFQTHEERRPVDLVKRCSVKLNKNILPWSVRGMVDAITGTAVLSLQGKGDTTNVEPASDPKRTLQQISNNKTSAVYVLLISTPIPIIPS